MEDGRRLTSFSHGAGCGCKLGPTELATVLEGLSLPAHTTEVLVGSDTGDDAAVVRLPDGHALVATLDFFTPIVDDPYDWGRIAATNALSDVYAMGGRPFLALNIVSWAGAAVLGGHSITDPEPKYGMVALGLADADAIVRNSTAAPGARLFLTKPLGLGIVSTAVKRGIADPALVDRAVNLMTTLNEDAALAMTAAGARAATDVTGFGLLGHLHRMLLASGSAARLDAGAVPVLEGALDLARADVVPGGSKRNHAYVSPHTDWGELTGPEQLVLADAQTSGGLLIAATEPEGLTREFASRAVPFAEVGAVEEGAAGGIRVLGRLSLG
jgi:selenide,water dikinase